MKNLAPEYLKSLDNVYDPIVKKNLALGLKQLGKYDHETLKSVTDPYTRIESNPRLLGLGSHPRDYVTKVSEANLKSGIKAGPDISNTKIQRRH